MKKRNGFVSNSSSSSFIIGIGKIKDETEVVKVLKEFKDEHCVEVLIHTHGLNSSFDKYGVGESSLDFYNVEAYVNSCPKVSLDKSKLKDGDKVLMVSVGNNEGDSDFWNEATGDMEYDIDESYYDSGQQKIFELFRSNALEHVELHYSVERNG